MKIGYLFDWFLSKIETLLSKDECDELLQKELTYVDDSSKLFVLITPWHSTLNYFSRLEKIVTSRKQSLIVYRFPENCLNSNYKSTEESFMKIKSDINLDLKDLIKEYGFKEIEIIGISLSCISALMIANGNSLINNVKLIVPGNCLAESLWLGIRTKMLREEFEKQGINLKQLKKYWGNLAPENNVSKLKDKKVSVFLSEADGVIPYSCGSKLVDAMKRNKLNFKLITNKNLGHYLTANQFRYNPSKFIE